MALLAHLDEPLRSMRIDEARALCLHAAANRERALASGRAAQPFELYVSSFFDGITGFLEAPAFEATLRRVGSADDGVTSGLPAL